MGDSEAVSERMCELHRQLLEQKIENVDCRVDNCNDRVDGILAEIVGVRDLQRQILYTIIAVLVLGIFTLGGVLLGRGVDFGFIVSQMV